MTAPPEQDEQRPARGAAIDRARLRRLRIAHGLDQQGLADAIDVKKSTISRYESGKRKPETVILARLAEALGTTVEDLLAE